MGAGSMEATYLAMIAFLDQAETLANTNREYVSAETALMIGEAKQRVIADFAAANQQHTLDGMRVRAEQERIAAQINVGETIESYEGETRRLSRRQPELG